MGTHVKLREQIRALCAQKGVSISQLERSCGLSPGAIAHWDDKMPSVERVARIADFFGVSLDALVGRTPPGSIGYAYLSMARSAEEKGLAPEDMEILIDAMQKMRQR